MRDESGVRSGGMRSHRKDFGSYPKDPQMQRTTRACVLVEGSFWRQCGEQMRGGQNSMQRD